MDSKTYTLDDIFRKICETIDVILLIDKAKDTYTTLRTNTLFDPVFGQTGSYKEMMKLVLESTADELVSKDKPYGIFLEEADDFTENIASHANMKIDGKEVSIRLASYNLDEDHFALMISEIRNEEYIKNIHKDQHINAIKSAYLFSMNVDLINDKCDTMFMSEVKDRPANEPDLAYTQWRKMILNMFPEEEHEMFNQISDPEYLKKNLKYHHSKSMDCQMKNLTGEFIWVKLIFNRIETGNEDEFCFLFMVEDIHESHIRLMNDLKMYENMARNDSLTGIANHGKIEKEINNSIEKGQKEKQPVSLIMFDIDYFKQVNDTFGHAVGDYVIRIVAELANKKMQANGGTLGRWGGEEFIGLVENADIDSIYNIAEDIRLALSEYKFDSINKLTASFGVIEVLENETAEEAFRRVDAKLYNAKNLGRNRVCK